MLFSKVTQQIEELNQDIRVFVDVKLEYFELLLLKKTTEFAAKWFRRLVLTIFFLMFLGMFSVAIAIIIGRYLDDYILGFFIVSGFYLLVFFLFLGFSKKILQTKIVKRFSKKMMRAKQEMRNSSSKQ